MRTKLAVVGLAAISAATIAVSTAGGAKASNLPTKTEQEHSLIPCHGCPPQGAPIYDGFVLEHGKMVHVYGPSKTPPPAGWAVVRPKAEAPGQGATIDCVFGDHQAVKNLYSYIVSERDYNCDGSTGGAVYGMWDGYGNNRAYIVHYRPGVGEGIDGDSATNLWVGAAAGRFYLTHHCTANNPWWYAGYHVNVVDTVVGALEFPAYNSAAEFGWYGPVGC